MDSEYASLGLWQASRNLSRVLLHRRPTHLMAGLHADSISDRGNS